MNITNVTTLRVRPGAHGFVVAAHVEGEALTPRAMPLIVKFGNVTARSVVPLLTGKGVRAVFSEMPEVGAPLSIGYIDEPLQQTRFEFVKPEEEIIASSEFCSCEYRIKQLESSDFFLTREK